jgi:predicted anti-sigma-YlaC factor YlaD
MWCEQVRDVLSARLDGESMSGENALAELHVEGCDACARWYDNAARITRLARMSVATVPDPLDDRLLDVVLPAAPGPGWSRTGRWLRVLLGVLGFGQFTLGMAQIAALGMTQGIGSADGMTSHHLLHESAAWNVAIGAAYLWIALRRGRAADALPIMTAFVGVLVLLSIDDLLTGEVVVTSLLTHTMVVLGYAVLVILRHPGFDALTPPGSRRWRLRSDDFADAREAVVRPESQAPTRGATATASVPASATASVPASASASVKRYVA